MPRNSTRKRRLLGSRAVCDNSGWMATAEQAIREAGKQLRPVYLLHGQEQLLLDKALRGLSELARVGSVPGLNEDLIDAGSAGDKIVEGILGAARTVPMMGARRLVVVRNVERLDPGGKGKGKSKSKSKDKAKKSQPGKTAKLDQLVSYCADPTETTVLLLLAPGLDKRRKLYTLAKKEGWLVSCEPLGRHELPRWIEQRARDRGNPLARGVADLLAEIAGPELAPLDDALERLSLYVGSGKTVTEQSVATCIVRIRPATVWALVDSVGTRDLGGALKNLGELLEPGDKGLQVLGTLAWSARQLLKFSGALRQGQSPEEAAKAAGVPPFKARERLDQVKRIPQRDLETWLQTLAQVDLDLKGGSTRAPRATLETAIIQLCRGKA